MSHEIILHTAQTSILRELLFKPAASFSQLQKSTGLSSDHFSFHITKLVSLNFVEKTEGKTYALTSAGKEFANKLDTDQNTIERQPKVAVILAIHRETNGQHEFIFQERLKHPYFGYWGFPTGKVRWGETILQTAARELKEETGLEANLTFKGVYHEHSFQEETGELLEDKLFFVVAGSEATGELTEVFEGGRNAWMTTQEMKSLKVFNSYHTELEVALKGTDLREEIQSYKKTEF
ncbi:hypothetical protein BH11PAT4_BH11PAT4_1140 [soil metagenome]